MIPRRTFLQQAAAASALALASTAAFAANRKPNIVYIVADDAGYGDIGCYGQDKFATPNIDRLAEEGLKFTDHYAGSTVCAPSRCVLMTGRHTGRCYIRGNREHQPIGQEPIPADTVTVADLLQEAGYATGAFGKWGLGYPDSTGDPLNQGFDAFFGHYCQRNAHRYYQHFMFHHNERIPLDGDTYTHHLIMSHALEFIRENQDRPFFCFLPVKIPHAAMEAPERYIAPFRERFAEFEDVVGTYAGEESRNPIAAFAGMMTVLDESVGQVLDLLEALGIDEDTIVMFSSDNGPHREGGHDPDFFNSNGPLRGYKRDLHEGGIRVPMLARWPGRIEGDTVTNHISGFQDILPTFCELAGASPPEDIDGLSFVPTLLDEPERQAEHEYLYWEFYERDGKRAARKGRWKAVQEDMHEGPGPVQLYDLDADIGEENDLANEHPEVVEEMLAVFDDAHTPSELWEFGAA